MPNSPVLLLLCAACVAFASSSSVRRQPLSKNSVEHHRTTAAVASSFNVDVKNGVEFKLDVRNNTKKMVELRFADGQTHDFVVLDESGKEVWRWSNERMFTQAMQNQLVKGKETATFSEDWDAKNMHGKFTAIALLKSNNHPIEERVDFDLK